MTLFGRTSCNEQRDWAVKVFFSGESVLDVTEQLNEKEATEFYEEFIKKLEDKSQLIEVIKDRGQRATHRYTLVKRNITTVELVRQ